MKRLTITLLTLLVLVGCTSELDRCIESNFKKYEKITPQPVPPVESLVRGFDQWSLEHPPMKIYLTEKNRLKLEKCMNFAREKYCENYLNSIESLNELKAQAEKNIVQYWMESDWYKEAYKIAKDDKDRLEKERKEKIKKEKEKAKKENERRRKVAESVCNLQGIY